MICSGYHIASLGVRACVWGGACFASHSHPREMSKQLGLQNLLVLSPWLHPRITGLTPAQSIRWLHGGLCWQGLPLAFVHASMWGGEGFSKEVTFTQALEERKE